VTGGHVVTITLLLEEGRHVEDCKLFAREVFERAFEEDIVSAGDVDMDSESVYD
jgi:hypothetical protein